LTGSDLPDLGGHRAIVTGANSGIGLRTAVRLAEQGVEVVLACRDPARGQAALSQLRAEVPAAKVELRELDLADLSSVHRFASDWAGPGQDRSLDLLVNNAGVMAIPHRLSADGYELQLATNHLGHYALTGLLLPALLTGSMLGGPARVVTVASVAHRSGRLYVDDLMLERGYAPWRAYGQSKLANLLFMQELQRRGNGRLASLAAHPGYAATNLPFASPKLGGSVLLGRLMWVGNLVLAQSAQAGALPTLRAATDPLARGGEYYGPGGVGEYRGAPKRVGMASRARDPAAAAWLWQRSAELTGVSYPNFG
jgi:NAD(P)-dependent dehydrogenase (short-subunit alcohol dehydrogenase family)